MEEYLGMIKIFAGSFAPKGWYYCDGRLLDIHRYQNLFSLIGNMYGGDGMNNFAVPNLNGRVAIGASSEHHQATTGGQETVILTKEQMPPHTHGTAVTASLSVSSTDTPMHKPEANASVLGATTTGSGRDLSPTNAYINADPDIKLSAKSITASVTENTVGGTTPVNLMQPFMAMNYIICVEGMYPPRP